MRKTFVVIAAVMSLFFFAGVLMVLRLRPRRRTRSDSSFR